MVRWQQRLSGVVLLACLPLGCAAPMTETLLPVPPPVSTPAPPPPAGPSLAQQLICRFQGIQGNEIVDWRDTQHLTLPQVLDRLDAVTAASITANPGDQRVASLAHLHNVAMRHHALVIYANPQWTGREAWAYAEYECLRNPPL